LPSPLDAVLERLFDDASLFPPLTRPMADALRAHADVASGPHHRMVGPFLCPATRLPELDACVAGGAPAPESLGVVGHEGFTGWRQVLATPGLVQVEAATSSRVPPSHGRVRRYVELVARDDPGPALDAIAAAGLRVKVRTAGPTRYAVPSCDWLAAVLVGCEARKLVLKAAGGLERPFRETGEGGSRHGFVNLLAAAAAARRGAPAPAVSAVLAAEGPDADELVSRVGGSRELVASISAASVDLPLQELADRALL
jgi:hypothetical protein